jgi:hemerythrin-like metal-binding protein
MHPLLEKEHQQLIDLLDALDKCILKGDSVNQVIKHLDDFVVLAGDHFKNEEKIMEDYKYTDIIDHKKEHARLLEQLRTLQSQLSKGQTPFGKDYMQLLRNWLEAHLLDTDNRLEEFLYQINADSDKKNR